MLILWTILIVVSLVPVISGLAFFEDVSDLCRETVKFIKNGKESLPRPAGLYFEITPRGPIHLALLLVGLGLYVLSALALLGDGGIDLPV